MYRCFQHHRHTWAKVFRKIFSSNIRMTEKCSVCKKTFDTVTARNNHQQQEHSESTSLTFINKYSATGAEVTKFFTRTNGLFWCCYCGTGDAEGFKTDIKSNLQRHLKTCRAFTGISFANFIYNDK